MVVGHSWSERPRRAVGPMTREAASRPGPRAGASPPHLPAPRSPMRLRPWHVLVCVAAASAAMVSLGYAGEGRAADLLLSVGVNLLSSVVIFLLLEIYLERVKLLNGKEVGGIDYRGFARNVGRSRHVRVLGTFIYPLTEHPASQS